MSEIDCCERISETEDRYETTTASDRIEPRFDQKEITGAGGNLQHLQPVPESLEEYQDEWRQAASWIQFWQKLKTSLTGK